MTLISRTTALGTACFRWMRKWWAGVGDQFWQVLWFIVVVCDVVPSPLHVSGDIIRARSTSPIGDEAPVESDPRLTEDTQGTEISQLA